MKSKKTLTAIVIVATILAIVVYALVSSIALKPTVTEGQFPFSITYELDGDTVTINDVYSVRYVKNVGYADTKSRMYVGEIGNMGEGNVVYTLKKDSKGRIELSTNFYADYMMGDAQYDYFDEDFEPRIYYYNSDEQEYFDEETLLAKGVKLISFEYPVPIENALTFSHISYFSGSIVFPTVLIALLALVAILILVNKNAELKYSTTDKASVALNFAICLIILPFVTVVASLVDINGGGPELYRQILYFIPSFMVLCVATSIAFRRAGCGKKSLVAQLIGPAVFGVYLVVCGILGLL